MTNPTQKIKENLNYKMKIMPIIEIILGLSAIWVIEDIRFKLIGVLLCGLGLFEDKLEIRGRKLKC